jgi:hypothetical protein
MTQKKHSENTETQSCKTGVSGSFFEKSFRKIPILISKNDEFKGWRAQIADTYQNYKTEIGKNINFEDLNFHFHHNINTHERDNDVFYTRKDAVECAKQVIENYKLNSKIWFL